MLLLSRGQLSQGWPEFEYRLTQSGWLQTYPHKQPSPRWDGSSLNRRRILVHDEQGYGDAIQFIRYLPWIKSQGATVILETRQPLAALLTGFHGIDELVVRNDSHRPEVPCDVHIPLLSLPMMFDTTLETIPSPTPYLAPDPHKTAFWKTRTGVNGFKVGFVWAGNPKHRNDAHRSCPLTCFEPLFQLEGVRFFSLQKGVDPCQKEELFDRYHISDCAHLLEDFSDTAGLIQNLDLVVRFA